MAPAQIRPTEISFIGTGDCGPVHGPADGFPIERYTELVRPVLQSVDLRFANCERQYSSRGIASKTSPQGRQPPEMAQIFTDCGFDAVTIANNHMYDYGPNALLDTRDLLLSKGIGVTGAGRDLDEARRPTDRRAQWHQRRLSRLLLGYSRRWRGGALQGRDRAAARQDRIRGARSAREPARDHPSR